MDVKKGIPVAMVTRFSIAMLFVFSLTIPTRGELAFTSVSHVSSHEITISAGISDGIQTGAMVNLLRKSVPIVHPLTGEVLGVPQEPVGVIEITRASNENAVGRLVKSYSQPQVDDVAEYERVVVEFVEPPEEIQPHESGENQDTILKESLERLAQAVEENRQSIGRIKQFSDMAGDTWDEVMMMKSYFSTLDDRLLALEDHQKQNTQVLSDLTEQGFPTVARKQFTISYAKDIDVQVGVRGKTLLLDVLKDSLDLHSAGDEAAIEGDYDSSSDEDDTLSWVMMVAMITWLGVLSVVLYRKVRPNEAGFPKSSSLADSHTFESGDDPK
jgi:hypothetical protein